MSERPILPLPGTLFCQLQLYPDKLLTLSPHRIAALTVEEGRAWITSSGDSADLVLDAGHRLALPGEGKPRLVSAFDTGSCARLRIEFRPATACWRLRLAGWLLNIGAPYPISIATGELQ